MHELMETIERDINSLPSIGLPFFDGQIQGDTHYIGVFATFSSEKLHVYTEVLMRFSPMEN